MNRTPIALVLLAGLVVGSAASAQQIPPRLWQTELDDDTRGYLFHEVHTLPDGRVLVLGDRSEGDAPDEMEFEALAWILSADGHPEAFNTFTAPGVEEHLSVIDPTRDRWYVHSYRHGWSFHSVNLIDSYRRTEAGVVHDWTFEPTQTVYTVDLHDMALLNDAVHNETVLALWSEWTTDPGTGRAVYLPTLATYDAAGTELSRTDISGLPLVEFYDAFIYPTGTTVLFGSDTGSEWGELGGYNLIWIQADGKISDHLRVDLEMNEYWFRGRLNPLRNGDVLIRGRDADGGPVTIARCSRTAGELWHTSLGYLEVGPALELADGTLLVTSHNYDAENTVFHLLDPATGDVLDSRFHEMPAGWVEDLTLAANGDILVTGYVEVDHDPYDHRGYVLRLGDGDDAITGFDSHPSPRAVAGPGLHPAYPNPFNATTTVSVTLPQPGPLRITVLDLLGRPVRTLTDGPATAGTHRLALDASTLPSGTYLLHAVAGAEAQTRRITLVR